VAIGGSPFSASTRFFSTTSPKYEAARHHVVERLPLLGEAGHDVSEESGDQIGDQFAEVAARGTAEADAMTGHVCYYQTKNLFPECGLPIRTLHQRVVQPGQDKTDRCGDKDDPDEHGDADVIHVFVRMEVVEEFV